MRQARYRATTALLLLLWLTPSAAQDNDYVLSCGGMHTAPGESVDISAEVRRLDIGGSVQSIPNGWLRPEANRRHRACVDGYSIPLTCQTSPCMVQISAEPSGINAWPAQNIRAFQGFSNGNSNESIEYGDRSPNRIGKRKV